MASYLQRRKVTELGGNTALNNQIVYIRPRTTDPTVTSFVLVDTGGVDIASSLSDNALSDWAFGHGAQEVVRKYDLGLGDEGRK